MQQGVVIWLTGLPNSGKTTISKTVEHMLLKMGFSVERLDSDEVPRSLTKELSRDWATRQKQKCSNLTFIAKLLYRHNIIVLIASVGRLREMRDKARAEIPDFAEIYLKSPLNIRLERDDLLKYSRYPETIHYYEEPERPEIIIDTDKTPAHEAARSIIDYLLCHGYISKDTDANGTNPEIIK